MVDGDLESLRQDVGRRLKRAFFYTKLWSMTYHGILGAAAILTVTVGILSAQKPPKAELIFPLSIASAILTTVGGFGGFERKWRVNRRTRAALEDLSIVLDSSSANPPECRETLRKIIKIHNEGIIGGDSAGSR